LSLWREGGAGEDAEGGLAMADAAFGSIIKPVCVEYVPEARVGDYVVVHVGFAISLLNEAAALRSLELLSELSTAAQSEARRTTAGSDS